MRRGQGGAATLELAIVAPIVFMLILAAAALGINQLGDTVGTNAARDGARRAVLLYANANNVASANYAAIASAVQSRLAGTVKGTPAVAVSCVHADGTPVGGTGTCDPSQVVAGSDMVQVSVTWTRRASTIFMPTSTRTDVSRMTIAGTPPSSGGSGSSYLCVLTADIALPGTVYVGGSELSQDIDVQVTISNLAACGIPTATTLFADYGTEDVAQTMALQTGNTYSITYYHDVGAWTTGTKVVQINAANALPVLVPIVVLPVPPPCTLQVSPLTGTINVAGSKVKNGGDLLITATVSGPICGVPTITALPPSTGGLDVVAPMLSAGNNYYTFDLGVDGGSNTPWTTGLKTVTVNAIGASVIVRVTVG